MKYPLVGNERLLVRNLSKGNIIAFNTLFRAYSGRLYRFAFGYLKSEAEAEEVVQEVFMTVWEKREELNEDLSFKSYLFTISFNIIRKQFRKRAHLTQYLNFGIYDDFDFRTSDEVTYKSLYQYITRLLDQLPPRRREVFEKSRFEGLSIREISDELKISHKTVENHLTEALKFLRMHLSGEK